MPKADISELDKLLASVRKAMLERASPDMIKMADRITVDMLQSTFESYRSGNPTRRFSALLVMTHLVEKLTRALAE